MANFNLTGQKIKNTYDQLAQVSASLLVDGLGSPTTISASNIQNFDTEVSKSAAEAGFGAGGGGGVSEAVFTAYTSSNDTKVDALIAATSSYLTSVPSGTVSGSSQVSYNGISDVPSGIVSGAAQLPQIGTNQTNIATLTSATSSYLTSLPSGVVSGSSQIDLGSATGTAANATSASYALTASYAENAGGGEAFPFTGSAGISGSINMNSNGEIQISNYTGSIHETSILIGQEIDPSRVNAPGDRNVQIGHYSRIVDSSTRSNVVVIGSDAEAAQGTVVIGQSARSLTDSGVAIGRDAEANDNYTITIGADSTANANNAILIGYNKSLSNNNEINIGDVFQYNNAGQSEIKLNAAVKTPTDTITISSNTASIDGASSNFFDIDGAGNPFLLQNPTNLQDGASYTFRITSGSGCVFDTNYRFESGSVQSLSTDSVDIVTFVSIGGSDLYGVKLLNLI